MYGQIEEMGSKIESLLAIWDGDDALDFANTYKTFADSFNRTQQTIHAIGGANVQVAGMFEEGEAERAQGARNLENL